MLFRSLQYVNIDGDRCLIDGIRVAIPYTLTFFGAVQVNAVSDGSTVQNCIADRFNLNGTNLTQSNNKTNAQWAAGCASVPVK